MAFRERWSGPNRPDSLAEIELPRRQSHHPSPADWRDEILYFLMVDRFSDGAEHTRPLLDRAPLGNPRPPSWNWEAWARSGRERWQGGTLKGVASKLDYLADLGVTTLWLSPVFKQRGHLDTYHGYGVADFLDVDPRFGSRRDLADLVAAAHARGMRVILDIIFNHSGTNWVYPNDIPGGAVQPLYTRECWPFGAWVDGQGGMTPTIAGPDDGVWPTELQHPGAYTRAGCGSLGNGGLDDPHAEFRRTDFLSLRDFDLDAPGVLTALANCYKYWIALTDCDGFRIDTLKHVTVEQARAFCGSIKEYAANLGKADFFLVGEVAGGDEAQDAYLDALTHNINAVLDIGEIRLSMRGAAKGLEPARHYFDGFHHADPRMGSHRNLGGRHVSILDDHDHVFGEKTRFSAEAACGHQVAAGAAMLLLSLGIPCLYYGTEQALGGPDGEGRRWLWNWKTEDCYLREAMFGPAHPLRSGLAGLQRQSDPALPGFGPFGTSGAHCFDPAHPAFRRVAALARVRQGWPVFRYGRQYARHLSLFRGPFAPPAAGELVAWSRILDDEEALVVVNGHGLESRGGDVVVDSRLNRDGDAFTVIANTGEAAGAAGPPHPVGSSVAARTASDGTRYLEIRDLPPSETVILVNRA